MDFTHYLLWGLKNLNFKLSPPLIYSFFESLKIPFKEVTMSMTFLFDSVDKEIISVLTNGIFEKDQLNYLLDNARQYANEKIFPLYNELVSKKYFK